MQEPIICKLFDISREQWQRAFDKAMEATDFDGLFHRLYMATETKWYTGPDSAREVAKRLFESAMRDISGSDRISFLTSQNIYPIASGCLELELRVYEGNFQCHISFDALRAYGSGFVYR